MTNLTREHFLALDQNDPLAAFRDKFQLPAGIVYLDGNSLGALPKATIARLSQVIEKEWGDWLITSWNRAGWGDLPIRLGDKIGQLIGAAAGQVIVADSTSINTYKTLAAALALNPDKHVILSTPDNFPTDLYMAQGLINQLGGKHTLKLVDGEEIGEHLNDDVAVLTLTHVNYKTGRMYDMPGLTARAHACGALTMWDLAHSAGALSVNLDADQVDFAVGCGYKYLNGGPGAPAFLYVAARHQNGFAQPLSGWHGHANPFAFDWKYEPAQGVARYICGTAPILSMAALECSVDMMIDANIAAIREKSLQLTDLFIAAVEQLCAGHLLNLATPRDRTIRGSQVSFHHPEGYAVMQALIANNIVGDFRAPDFIRFGFTPLYVRYVDVWDAAVTLKTILDSQSWDRPEWKQRKKIT